MVSNRHRNEEAYNKFEPLIIFNNNDGLNIF